jgi:hypothetical protein
MAKEMTSEDSIKRKKIYTSNRNIINSKTKYTTSLVKNSKINMNFRLGDFFKKQKSYNNNREGYKSSEKKNEEKKKNIEDIREKTINLQYNINEIFGNKKYNEQIKPFLQNNGNLYEAKNISNNISNNNSINKIMKKN